MVIAFFQFYITMAIYFPFCQAYVTSVFLEDRFFSSESGGYMNTQNCAFEKYKKKYSLHFDTDESADQLIVME